MPKQHQRVSPPTIPKDPIDDHKKYTLRKRKKPKEKNKDYIIHFVACCHCKETNIYLLPLKASSIQKVEINL